MMLNSSLQPGQRLHGFLVKKVSDIAEVRAVALELEHEKTGARLLHLLADDSENLFAVAFRTPPQDDTGLPHILEHTVLCGSQKYPVKDPFVELLKTSLATFLNAMTYPDKTVYPCASMNEHDFFNLASVYCDAVFKPIISEMHFKQEGHHLEFSKPDDATSELTINGIVYNEMKGVYSSLDGIIESEDTRRICPDNAYGLDYGGDPKAIPNLTYAQFKAFHQRYYHPSNAYLFLYGNIDTARHLEFLDREYLSHYDRLAIDTTIRPQPRWSEPRQATIPYPAAADEPADGHTALTISWLTNEITDAVKSLAMNVLDSYLLSNAASPLRKAIIDAKLGEELTASGYADYLRDTFFSVGIKGSAPEKAQALLDLVLKVCRDEAARGFERDKVEAAFQQLELSSLEIKSQYPLRLMDNVYRSWLYDADPAYYLRVPAHLQTLRTHFENTPRFFETLLLQQLVDNPHRVQLAFVPDAEYNTRTAAEFAQKMAARKAALTPAQTQTILRETAELEKMQITDNTPEALATLPHLNLSDVNPEPIEPASEDSCVDGLPFIESKIFTGGIDYVTLSFDLRDFTPQMLEYLPVFADAVTGMGAGGLDYAAFAEKEAACCSGVSAVPDAFGRVDDGLLPQPFLFFSVHGLQRQLEPMLEVFRQRILEADFTDTARLHDILLQARVGMHSSLIPQGNMHASLQAARSLSPNIFLKEQFVGFSALRLFDRLADHFDPAALVPQLQAIQKALTNRNRLTLCAGGSEASIRTIKRWYAAFAAELPQEPIQPRAVILPAAPAMAEGIATPADVAFVARALPSVPTTHPAAPALNLLGLNLSYGYLWNEVRVRRGAYGCRASHQPAQGIFTYSSYRDPNINETLAVYDQVYSYIQNELDLSAPAVEQAIIGTIKTLDVPWRPAQALSALLTRRLTGSTLQLRREYRQRLLRLTAAEIRQAAQDCLQGPECRNPVCILSSREKLQAAQKAGLPLLINDL